MIYSKKREAKYLLPNVFRTSSNFSSNKFFLCLPPFNNDDSRERSHRWGRKY